MISSGWSVLGCCLGVRFSYLVEVDVHALELEIGSTVVPVACQMKSLALSLLYEM